MKTIFAKHSGRIISFAAVTVLALSAWTAQALILPVSPTGQWDCVISGPGQTGIIFLNFTEDVDTNSGFPTFEGFFLQAGHQANTAASTSGRGTTGTGRSGSGANSFTNLFGGGFIEGAAGPVAENGTGDDWLWDSRGHRGNWFYNSKGQVVGSYYTVLNATSTITNFFQTCVDTSFSVQLTNGNTTNFPFSACFTNAVLNTNVLWFAAEDQESGFTNLSFTNYNYTLGSIGVTNNISFVGKVVRNKRITLVGTSTYGKFTITGVPLNPVNIKSGFQIADGPYLWTGTKSQDGFKLAEEFMLTADIGIPTPIPNVYGMTGQGPSYSYGPTNSFCMISANKKIGFVVSEAQVNGAASTLHFSRASIGPFTNNKRAIGSKTVGDSIENLDLIKFNVSVTPFVP
jgi:hypothetical protein